MTPKKISRRDAIKLLGAATGATLLANLPSKWSTPELASGVLPAHAQTSGLVFVNGGFINALVKSLPQDGSGVVQEVSAPFGIAGCIFNGTHWVEISQKIQNIPLILEVTSANPVQWFTPVSDPTGIYNTDSNGKVEIDLNMQFTADIVFKWMFKNSSDGSGEISFTLTCNGNINTNEG